MSILVKQKYKDLLITLSILAISFLLGMLWYKKRWFPIRQISIWRNPPVLSPYIHKLGTTAVPYAQFLIAKYYPRLPLFSDRQYYDSIGDKRLNDFYILQLPRHYFAPIKLKLERPANIYRGLTDRNDNSIFKGWVKSNIPIEIQGNSCRHDRLVKKSFLPGTITLAPGGPSATSPIFIEFKKPLPKIGASLVLPYEQKRPLSSQSKDSP